MTDAKVGLDLALSRQQLLFGPRTVGQLVSTDLARLHHLGPVTMTEMARRMAAKAQLEGDQLLTTGESAYVAPVDAPSLQQIAKARRARR